MFAQSSIDFWGLTSFLLVFWTVHYLVVVLIVSVAVWIVTHTKWPHRKIQTRRATGADIRREILSSLRSVVAFALFSVLAAYLTEAGLAKLRTGMRDSLFLSVAWLSLMFVAHDAYFYWTHRAMHLPRLYKWFHQHHHRSIAPTAWAAYSFSIPEAIVQGMFPLLFLMLVPMHRPEFFAFMTLQLLRNAYGHCGVEIQPRGVPNHPVFGMLTTSVHHDLHHSGGFNSNFGLWFVWWDRLMGTEHPRYRAAYERVTTPPEPTPTP